MHQHNSPNATDNVEELEITETNTKGQHRVCGQHTDDKHIIYYISRPEV
jgi:hypothetical protein